MLYPLSYGSYVSLIQILFGIPQKIATRQTHRTSSLAGLSEVHPPIAR